MSGTNNDVEWVETTEEVVVTDDGPPSENHLAGSAAAVPDPESVKTPIQRLLDSVGQGESVEADGGFYCEECLALFQNRGTSGDITGPSFILDFPASTGIPQRALLTLPYGLVIGRSSIPNAGVGVLNNGPVVSPGMHFGPYEGEVTAKENALSSNFSWEIYKGEDTYEYIDGVRESHSNWMRYVICARNKEESNLSAVEYNGIILFHCSRAINPGDELLVWPSGKLFAHFTDSWTQVWFSRVNGTESNSTAPVFLCPHCQLTFNTEAFLQRHIESLHLQPDADTLRPNGAAPAEDPAPRVDSAKSLVVLALDSVGANTCEDCGKFFKQIPHLRRHKLCVHSNKRPYCCPQCRRSFSQASGLIRHQTVHRKQATAKEAADQSRRTSEEEDSASPRTGSTNVRAPEEAEETGEVQSLPEGAEVAGTVNSPAAEAGLTQLVCSDCGKTFSSNTSLRRHKVAVHESLRPYACTVCRKCFRQYSDLTRHLQHHRKQSPEGAEAEPPPESTAHTHSCEDCSLTFSSGADLQQHLSERHSEELAVEPQDDTSKDPDFKIKPSSVKSAQPSQKQPSPRPQRLRAQSRISAITKLIAPKRRAAICKKAAAPAETGPSEPDTSAAKRRFSCNRCTRTCANAAELEAHKCILRQHKCGHCGATFIKSGFLKRHQQTAHAKLRSFRCERCNKPFRTSGSLRQHQKSNACVKYHCASELFSCTFCQFSFTMKSYLVKHIKRHHPQYMPHCESDGLEEEEKEEGRFVCPHCSESCTSAKEFKSHACFQQGKVLYLCPDCGKGFTNHYGLKQHQRVHTGEKPYKCPHCSKSFSYNGQLTVHLRIHTGEKPYLCTHCGESFRQSGDLKRHERKHTGVRPYSCAECCKSFSRPQSLKAHQMLHLGQKMFKCTQCGKSFSRSYHLRRHHQKMHS